jgi:two-component system, OmpR family, phosphate regulon sensor histidine kinase PhoR
VRRRIFFRLMAAFVVVIAVVAFALELAITREPGLSSRQHLENALILAAIFGLAVGFYLSWAAARLIGSRLNNISSFALRIAAGDLTARLNDASLDEIGKIAVTLDDMAEGLEARFHELRNSSRQLETLLNSMQDAVIAVSREGKVEWANRRLERLVGQSARVNAAVVETVRDPDFLSAVREAADTQAVSSARATSVAPGRVFGVTAAPMPEGGAVAVLRDLTESERLEKTRRDFIANVSHELRTPLTSIQGYAETLLDAAPGSNNYREFLEIIRKNAARMARLTEDLLTLARVESGEQDFDVAPTSTNQLLDEAVQSFREISKSRGIEIQVENNAPEELVNADHEAIHQVMANLVDNAIKYAPSGTRIVLGARPAASGIEFFVRDFGPGIPSEHLPRLFERFYRVDKARSRESGGTGLGLAIAKHIVLAHGGSIRAESELNHGSTFVFSLPRAAALATPHEEG